MKKRTAALAMSLLMAAGLMSGCNGSGNNGDTGSTAPPAQTQADTQSAQTKDTSAADTSAPAAPSSESAGGEEKEITIWGWDKSFNGYALEQADQLFDGAKVNFVEMGKADVLKKIHTVLASGVTEDLPDAVLISDLAAQGYLMSYPGAFREMSDVLNYDDFADYKTAAVSYGGKQYGVPFDTGVAALFYRTDYLSEIGYTEEKMQDLTWEEYLSLGTQLKEKGHLLQTFNPNDIAEFQIMLQSAGKWFTDNEGNADFVNNPELKECYSIFKQLNDSDFVKLASDWTEFTGAINSGEVACVLRGSWISSTILAGEDQAGKWAIAPIPKLSSAQATHYSNQGGSSWFVLKNGANSDLAAEFFAQTFGGNKELYNTLLENKNIVGTYLPAQEVSAYQSKNDFYGGQQVNLLLAQWLSEVPAVNTGAFSAEAQAALLGVTPEILSGGDLDSCLQKAKQQFEQMIQ